MSRKSCPACGQPLSAAVQALVRELREEVARLDQDARRFDARGLAVFAADVRVLRGRLVEILLLLDQPGERRAP